jgi:hypothetical protein
MTLPGDSHSVVGRQRNCWSPQLGISNIKIFCSAKPPARASKAFSREQTDEIRNAQPVAKSQCDAMEKCINFK